MERTRPGPAPRAVKLLPATGCSVCQARPRVLSSFAQDARRQRYVNSGLLLLDLLLGAHVELMGGDDWSDQGERVRHRARELQVSGKKVHVARVGDESNLGLYACAYVHACLELIEQAAHVNLRNR